MTLMPPSEQRDRTPLYTVDVHPNCFSPASFITTVWHGHDHDEDFVGRFEFVMHIYFYHAVITIYLSRMGLSRDDATIYMNQKRYMLKDVSIKVKQSKNNIAKVRTYYFARPADHPPL